MPSRDKPENAFLPLTGIIGAATIACLIIFAASGRLELPMVGKDDSVYSLISGIVGMTGLAVGGYGVYLGHRASSRSHEHTYLAQLGARFKDGAELLSSERTTAHLAGIAVLSVLAREAPEHYFVNSLKSLTGFIAQVNSRHWSATGLWAAEPNAYHGSWPSSDLRTVDALVAISQLAPPKCSWPIDPSISYKNRFVVEQLYACDMFLEDETFDNMHFRRMIARRARFFKCSFRNTVIHVAAGGDLIFDECDLSDAIILPTNTDLKPITSKDRAMTIKGGLTKNLTIGGIPFAAWKTLELSAFGITSQLAFSPQWLPELKLPSTSKLPLRPKPLD